jgi:hypothetical protein
MSLITPNQVERSISRLNETSYGVDRTNADDFRRIISDAAGIAALSTAFADDQGYDNGSDVPSDKWATTVDAGVNFTPDFCFQDIGYFLKDFLGAYSVSGAAAPYIHVFTPQDMNTSRQLPSRTYLEKLGGLYLRKLSSIVGTQLKISGGKMGRLKVSAQYTGSGKYAKDPAGYTSPAVTADREWAYGSQAFFRLYDNDDGTAQQETATAAGTITGSGNATVVVTAAGLTGSPNTVSVPVTSGDTAAVWADKVRVALRNHLVISNFFAVSGTGTAIILTARVRAANDSTLNISLDNGTSTGITTAGTSANTTAGVVGDAQSYTCDLESWSLTIDTPPVDPGYRQCSDYVVAGDPRSGQARSEFYVGARKFTFSFTARLNTGDKTRDWMQAGTDVTLEIPIVGIDSGNSSLRMVHTRGLIDSAQETPDVGGFVGISGSVDLMSNSGTIPFTATLMNDVASYAS